VHSTSSPPPIRAEQNTQIRGDHGAGEQSTSLELVSGGRSGIETELRQGIDEPRPAFGMLVAFEPPAGDGGLYGPQTAVPKLCIIEPVEGLSRLD
jgi:hypothetical protein